MESSRVFVRGLPPRLTEEEFRKHFSTQWSPTDAKLIPHRRIGYVGYKTPEEAAKAAKYFHKSFIRMSRIVVEIARPVDDDGLPRPQSTRGRDSPKRRKELHLRNNTPPPNSRNNLKRKRDVGEDEKLQEFLEVMQPPSRSKTWANGDAIRGVGHDMPKDQTVKDSEGERSGDHEPVLENPKETVGDIVGDGLAFKHMKGTIYKPLDELSVPSERNSITDNTYATETEREIVEQSRTLVSDVDWLRSRTSRLLGLQDNVEDLGPTEIRYASADTNSHSETGETRQGPLELTEGLEEENAEERGGGDRDAALEVINASRRLFVRNLSYGATEDDLRDQFSPFGSLEEVHLAIDPKSGSSKGFAYILYRDPSPAVEAYKSLDGKIFQGRLLHILAASPRRENKLDEFAISKLSLKKQKQLKRRAEAATSLFNWNSLYMNADAVMSSISDRLGVSKSALLDPTSAEAAVKQAHAETHLIQETKAYFSNNGIDLGAFQRSERGDMAILVKNFPYGTRAGELKDLFEEFGQIRQLLMPPAGTIAIVEFAQAPQARAAFATLAYRRFKDSILFLEKAPKDLFTEVRGDVKSVEATGMGGKTKEPKPSASDLKQASVAQEELDTTTLFVRNLSFATTTERLTDVFRPLDGLVSARVKTKPDPKKSGHTLSMGFGFLEFRTKEQAKAALIAMNGYDLDGHRLVIRASHKIADAAEEQRREDRAKKLAGRRTKIIIKNLPFESTKKDVRSLFSAYGQLRSVRVPKKFDSSARGFAFADFVTAREAENAIEALRDTHLLGRKLVLEFASGDPLDAEEEIEKMQKKARKQENKVALQRLTGGGRKKFTVDGNDEAEGI
ncbi:MAG: Multiple RNA-binding domain-containing protein 1 [Geoglossum simile]|nr:MAG: Multiple RNA-binding domain-containing protein 1 [Geoglossum simile]